MSFAVTTPGFGFSIYFCQCIFWFVCVSSFVVLKYHAKWLAWKNVSEMTYFLCRVEHKTYSASRRSEVVSDVHRVNISRGNFQVLSELVIVPVQISKKFFIDV